MTERTIRAPVKLSPREGRAISAAAKKRDMPRARFMREAALAVADGRVLPKRWFRQSLDTIGEAVERLRKAGGNDDLVEALVFGREDFVFAADEEDHGFDPRETGG